ncbi:MAG TPA: sialidase family protein, partial [Thermoplasmata archaeon]|nr:sialidase family protein [Thermoplasmata archaeon]
MTKHATGRTGFRARYGLLAAILIALLGVGPSAPRASGNEPGLEVAGDPGSGWITDVQTTTDTRSDIQPSLTTDANGNLLLAYASNAGGDYDVLFQVSTDYGRTWTVPVTVAGSGLDEVSPSITTDPFSGRIFIAYQAGRTGATTILSAYSDTGALWTSVTILACSALCERPKVASEYWNAAANVQYLVFGGELSAGTDWDWGVYRSTNQGVAWTLVHESGFGIVDVRHHPAIAVQRGTDGVDRAMVFYRQGAGYPGTAGSMEWTADGGTTWNGPSAWAANVNSPPEIAAAPDGDSVVVVYSTAANAVVWAVDMDPTNLTWGGADTTWDQFPNGANAAITADGVGSATFGVGGRYHVIYRATTNDIMYATALVSLTDGTAWAAPVQASDTAATVSVTWPDKTATTVYRGGSWRPAIAWTDFRDGLPDYNVYFTTPGARYTITTNPSGLQVTIDGTTSAAPAVVTWFPGEVHTISTASPQLGAPGWRYTYVSWSDGGGQSHSVTAVGDAVITATFSAEVLLTINSLHGGVSGAGWYTPGAFATLYAASPQPGPAGTRYEFTAWTGDVLSTSNPATLLMDEPKAVTANWLTQFELAIISAHGNVSGAGWYRSGDPAIVTIAQRDVTEGGRTWQFTGWSGDATGAAPTVNLTMDGPRTVTANWREKPGLFSAIGGALLLVALLLAVLFVILLAA